MFLRKYWIPLAVFIMAIAGVGLCMLATQPPKEPIKIYKEVKPIEKPTTQAPMGDTSQGGHFRADGNPWHEGPHEPRAETPPAAVPTLSDAELAAIPEDMPKPDIPLPTDLKNVDYDTWKQWREKHHREWMKYIHALNPAIERISKEVEAFGNLPPENSPDYEATKAKWNAKILEKDRLIDKKGWRIHEADAARREAYEKYSLARFGKK